MQNIKKNDIAYHFEKNNFGIIGNGFLLRHKHDFFVRGCLTRINFVLQNFF